MAALRRLPGALLHRLAVAAVPRRGAAALAEAAEPATAAATRPFNPAAAINVLVGTQTGTAMSFAESLRDAAEERLGAQVNVIDLAEYDPAALPSESQVVLIMACYGVGEPTDNAKAFYSALMAPDAAASNKLGKLSYAVFGLGSSGTHKANYNVVAKRLDERLAQLGAQRAFPLGLGDDSAWYVDMACRLPRSIEVDFQQWQTALLDALASEGSGEDAKAGAAPVAAPAPTREEQVVAEPPYGLVLRRPTVCTVSAHERTTDSLRQRSFYQPATAPLRVLYRRPLNPSYADSMVEMGIAAAAPGVYATGDHVGIYPENDPALVQRLLDRLELNGDDEATLASNRPTTCRRLPVPDGLPVREILGRTLELQAMPSPHAISVLAAAAADPAERARLAALATGPELYKDSIWRRNRHLPDLLDEYRSVRLTLSGLLQAAPVLRPRFYSISSSALETPDQIQITYRTVRYTSANGHTRTGVCTGYLNRLNVGATPGAAVQAYVRTSTFRQPADPATPVVFVAGGSGIAPVRGFLQERHFRATAEGVRYGRGLLLFGVRCPEDEACRDLIQDCVKAGALTSAAVSYSQAPAPGGPAYTPKVVAHDVEAHGADIWRALQAGGHIYLCGGASAFAASCMQALRRVFHQHGGLTTVDAQDQYFQALMQRRQYQEDLAD